MGFLVCIAVACVNPWDLGDPVAPSDLARFPYDADTCAGNYFRATSHCNWVSHQANLAGLRPALVARHGDHWPQLWLERARRCLRAWDHLDNAWRAHANGDPTEAKCQRQIARHLRLLRGVIGAEMYDRGEMPPVVPYEFFAEIP